MAYDRANAVDGQTDQGTEYANEHNTNIQSRKTNDHIKRERKQIRIKHLN